MIDDRDLLERALQVFEPDPGLSDRVMRRRERKRRNQRISAGILGLAIVVAGAVGAASVVGTDPVPLDTDTPAPSTPDPQADRKVVRFSLVDIATGTATPMPASITDIEGVANIEVSPDGTMLVFDNSGDSPSSSDPGLHQIFIVNADGSALQQVTDDPLGATQPSWSSDGERIVYVGGRAILENGPPRNISIIDLATGVPFVVAETDGGGTDLEEPHFWDAGSIAYTRLDYRRADLSMQDPPQYDLWIAPIEGGKPELLLEERGWADRSPDGTSILYTRDVYWEELGSRNGVSMGIVRELWMADADGGDPRVLVPVGEEHEMVYSYGWSPDGGKIAYSRAGDQQAVADRHRLFVLDRETGQTTFVTTGRVMEWLDDDTLIVRTSEVPDEEQI